MSHFQTAGLLRMLIVLSALLASACQFQSKSSVTADSAISRQVSPLAVNPNEPDSFVADFSDPESEAVFHVLAAELSASQNNALSAIEHYLGAARVSRDPEILRLATINAARAGQTEAALDVSRNWVSALPDSLEARQYLALLLLRTDQYVESAEELNTIRVRVDADVLRDEQFDHPLERQSDNISPQASATESSEKQNIKPTQDTQTDEFISLPALLDPDRQNNRGSVDVAEKVEQKTVPGGAGEQFVARMLELESHHEQALLSFQSYIKSYGYPIQTRQQNSRLNKIEKTRPDFKGVELQQLTLADLAIKAEKYGLANHALLGLENEQALMIRAKALQKLGQYEAGIDLLSKLIDTDSASDSLRLEYVKLLVAAERKDEATRQLAVIVNKYPDNKDLLSSLIVLNIDQKRWNQAEQLSLRLLEHTEYVSEAQLYLGEIYEARHQIDKAIAAYQQVSTGKQADFVQKRIPVLLERQRGLPAARLWLHQQRLKHKNSRKQALLNKIEADLLLAHNDREEALEHYQRALVLDPGNSDFRFSRALLYEQRGNVALAERDFLHILESDANDKTALHALGTLLSRNTHRFDEALSFVSKAHSLDPKDAEILGTLGWLYFRRGDTKKAELLLRRAFNQSQQPVIANHLIEVLQSQGQSSEARLILLKMRRLFPHDPVLKKTDEKIKQYNKQDS